MKREYMLIILTSTILGIFMGNMFRDYDKKQNLSTGKYSLTKKEVRAATKSIKSLKHEKENLEDEFESLKNDYEDIDKIKEINKLKEDLSYTDIKGQGIIIRINALNEEIGNIANFVDYNKILINILNEIKINGGKHISINGQRINQYSEIVLAGNHININSLPVAPPYEIKVIGDIDKLSVYIKKGSDYLESIQKNHPLKLELKIDNNISMEKMSVPNKLKYMKGE